MSATLDTFQKSPAKRFLVCVDSDGCAMDTMDIKHFQCFGPCMVAEWGLEEWQKPILTRWNEINLYTMTRGVNRYKGLALALREINDTYRPIDGLDALTAWVDTSRELSNTALARQIEAEPGSVILPKALAWSKAVNAAIDAIPMRDKKPFPGVAAALALAHETADVAIVSSANLGAVLDEWGLYGLLENVDVICAQEAGSKAHCIAALAEKGYDKADILMCGDAPGDQAAAQKNGVAYYPILVRHETESWAGFGGALKTLETGGYAGAYQAARDAAFIENLQ